MRYVLLVVVTLLLGYAVVEWFESVAVGKDKKEALMKSCRQRVAASVDELLASAQQGGDRLSHYNPAALYDKMYRDCLQENSLGE